MFPFSCSLDLENPFGYCQIGCALREIPNTIYDGKALRAEEIYKDDNKYDAQWYDDHALQLSDYQRQLILQYADELGINMNVYPWTFNVQDQCNKCYTLNVGCCKHTNGECRSSQSEKVGTLSSWNSGEQKSKKTEYHRVVKEKETGFTHGQCKEKVIVGGYTDCNRCKFHWAGGGPGAVWKSCDAYNCYDNGGTDQDFTFLTKCKDDAHDDCDWQDWVYRDQLSNIFGNWCVLGGKKKLCSTCTDEKVKDCKRQRDEREKK